jgi:amino acid transporter
MIDYEKLFTILIEAGAFVSAIAAFVAAVIMFRLTKKFGTGILASSFKSISIGIFTIAIAILIDAVLNYASTSGIKEIAQFITILTVIKLVLLVLGTYIIVIGSKKTGDKLEHVTK